MIKTAKRLILVFSKNHEFSDSTERQSLKSGLGIRFRILILCFILAAGLYNCGKKQQQSSQRGSGRRGGPVFVEVKVLEPQLLLNRINTTGTILANEKVDLKPEVSGRVTNIYFMEGSRVAKGKLLLKINDSDLQAQLNRNKAQEELLTDDVYRKLKLLEIRAISQEEYDAAGNQLKIVQAEKQLIEAQIAKTEIYAPFSGKIGLRSVSPGNFVVNNTVIATLQQLDPVKIEFDVPEKYSALIREGMQVNFNLENMDSTFTGKIYAVESSINPDTRTLTVRALSSNSGWFLIPGSYAKISIVLETFPDAIKVPSEALITALEGNSVFLLRNGKAKKVMVTTGIRTENEVQITDGISSGDSLIITGLLQIVDGSPVTLVRENRNLQISAKN